MAVTKETPANRTDARGCVFGFLVKPSIDEAFLYSSTSDSAPQRDRCVRNKLHRPSEAFAPRSPIQSLARAIIDAC